MKYIFDNDPSHRLKRIEFLFGEKESFLRKGLEFPSERIDIKSTHNYRNVNIAIYSGQEKTEAINDFSRLGLLGSNNRHY